MLTVQVVLIERFVKSNYFNVSDTMDLLDEDNNGLIINSVHSTEGCYTYTKEIHRGECSIELSNEEKVALDQAMGE